VTGPSRDADADVITARRGSAATPEPGGGGPVLAGPVPSPVYASPGLRGQFAQGSAEPFPAGEAPCAPSP